MAAQRIHLTNCVVDCRSNCSICRNAKWHFTGGENDQRFCSWRTFVGWHNLCIRGRILLLPDSQSININQISPPRLRSISFGGLAFFAVVLQLIGLAVVRSYVPDIRPSAFRTVFALQWLVGGLPIIAFFFSPEYVTKSLQTNQV